MTRREIPRPPVDIARGTYNIYYTYNALVNFSGVNTKLKCQQGFHFYIILMRFRTFC